MAGEPDWDDIWRVVEDFATTYHEDVVLIGGVAVYLHLVEAARADLPVEYTHDADMYVALASWGDIRDKFPVSANRRLDKHQIEVDGVEFDLYLEANNALRVNYPALRASAVRIEGVLVAGLEHLLLLKLDAARARWSSPHGAKDRRDIAKLLILMSNLDPVHTLAMCSDEDVALLERVEASDVFAEVADGNAHLASQLRRAARDFVQRLKRRRS